MSSSLTHRFHFAKNLHFFALYLIFIYFQLKWIKSVISSNGPRSSCIQSPVRFTTVPFHSTRMMQISLSLYLKIESQKTGARASVKYRLPAEFKNITSKDFQIFQNHKKNYFCNFPGFKKLGSFKVFFPGTVKENERGVQTET